jgi:hypothetical protein
MLTSAREQYAEQQRISALGLRQARRAATRGTAAVAAVLSGYQLHAAALTFDSTAAILAEQSIEAPSAGTASLSAVTTGAAAIQLLDQVQTDVAFDRLILSLIQDAGRTATAVDIGRRPALTGYVRSLNLPSCSRCAILAGRVYRYSTGFQRHPACDCLMTPTTESAGRDLVLDPTDAIKSGQIRGLSKGDHEALDAGADLGQVVNVRRKQAGLRVGSSVIARGDRLTPQGILRIASDRDEVLRLLRQHRYLK